MMLRLWVLLDAWKVPLRDVPRGVAQERIEKHILCIQHAILYHTYEVYDTSKYYITTL